MSVNPQVFVVRGKASRRIKKKYEQDRLGGSCYRGRTQFETNCLGCRKLIFFCSTYNVDFNTAQNGPTIRLKITKFLHCNNLTRATSQCSAWSVLKVGWDKTTPK